MCANNILIQLSIGGGILLTLAIVVYVVWTTRQFMLEQRALLDHAIADSTHWRKRAIAAESMIHDQPFNSSAP